MITSSNISYWATFYEVVVLEAPDEGQRLDVSLLM